MDLKQTMQQELLERNVSRFFDEFVEAFRTFDGATIAQRYQVPYLAFHGTEPADVFTSAVEVAGYFQRIVVDYYAKGVRSCRYDDLAIVPMGRECVLATVTWHLLCDDGRTPSTWRESYNLHQVDDRFMVFASTDHLI
jgi:hypothetical protein